MNQTTHSSPQSEMPLEMTSTGQPSLIRKIADKFHVEPRRMLNTLKQTAFRQKPDDPEVTDEQMMALLIVADQYGLNPFTKELFAFPDKRKGIIPIVSIDGWSRIINRHDQYDGMEFRQSETIVMIDDDAKAAPEWMECVIYRKDRGHPTVIREYLDEVYRPAFVGRGGNGEYKIPGPWQSHTKRFLRWKSMIQSSRVAFGFAGIYDQDEGERIIEGEVLREESNRPAVGSVISDDINAGLMGGNAQGNGQGNGQGTPALADKRNDGTRVEFTGAVDHGEQQPAAAVAAAAAATQATEAAPAPATAPAAAKVAKKAAAKRRPGRPSNAEKAARAKASQAGQAAGQGQQTDSQPPTPPSDGQPVIDADQIADELAKATTADQIDVLQDFSRGLQDPKERDAIAAIAANRRKDLGL